MYKRILVATGPQPWMDTAVEYAITLAADTGAELSILTVLTPHIVVGMPDMTACSAMVLESVAGQSRATLGLAAATAEAVGVACNTQLRWGNMPGTILASAAAHDCDLIILGTRHSTWRQRRLHDYTTKRVAARARQPVLLVSQAPSPQYGAPLWSSVLVIRDSSWRGEAAEAYAYALAQTAFLDVSVLHLGAVTEHMEAAYLSAAAMLDQPCHWPMPVEAAEMVYAGLAATSQTTSTLVETVTSSTCDVIILGVHQDTGWLRWLRRQPARTVLEMTDRPVLLVNQWLTD